MSAVANMLRALFRSLLLGTVLIWGVVRAQPPEHTIEVAFALTQNAFDDMVYNGVWGEVPGMDFEVCAATILNQVNAAMEANNLDDNAHYVRAGSGFPLPRNADGTVYNDTGIHSADIAPHLQVNIATMKFDSLTIDNYLQSLEADALVVLMFNGLTDLEDTGGNSYINGANNTPGHVIVLTVRTCLPSTPGSDTRAAHEFLHHGGVEDNSGDDNGGEGDNCSLEQQWTQCWFRGRDNTIVGSNRNYLENEGLERASLIAEDKYGIGGGGPGGGGGFGGDGGYDPLGRPYVTPICLGCILNGGYAYTGWHLHWSPVVGATYYVINISGAGSFTSYSTQDYIEMWMLPGVPYFMQVTACNNTECGSPGFAVMIPDCDPLE